MRTSLRQIATFIDSVEQPTTLRELIAKHRWDGSVPIEQKSLRAMAVRHNEPRSHEFKFLALNTFLMDVWGGAYRDIIGIGPPIRKPAVGDRAPRIGQLVRGNFDIALLSEIFENNVKDLVLSAWRGADPQPSVVEDSRRRSNMSSGLVTVSVIPLSYDPNEVVHEYTVQSRLRQDGLADKGVLFSSLPLDFVGGSVELYNTHLDASDADVRAAQVGELAAFITRTHRPENVAILAGDFNIDSRTAEYINLRDAMRSIDLEDIWQSRNGTPGFTNLSENNSEEIGELICQEDSVDSLYCDDFDVPPADFDRSSRIDYIFVSEPNEAHAYNLDFSRPRRVRHERRSGAPERNRIAYLSDHLGLSTTLLVSPK